MILNITIVLIAIYDNNYGEWEMLSLLVQHFDVIELIQTCNNVIAIKKSKYIGNNKKLIWYY